MLSCRRRQTKQEEEETCNTAPSFIRCVYSLVYLQRSDQRGERRGRVGAIKDLIKGHSLRLHDT